jgi:hypothetical protein
MNWRTAPSGSFSINSNDSYLVACNSLLSSCEYHRATPCRSQIDLFRLPLSAPAHFRVSDPTKFPPDLLAPSQAEAMPDGVLVCSRM